jgi:hypothetical protein
VTQQINLFNPILLKQKKYFSAFAMVEALGLILLGCGLLVVYANFQSSIRAKEAAATAAQLLKTKAQLIAISAEFAPHKKNQALDDDLKKTETDITSMQRVFDALQGGGFGNTKGYSGYFRAFSRQIVDGLWLTGVGIVGAGHDISLRGRTINPELVPVYLTRLKREPEMQGKSFSALNIQTPKVDAPAYADTKAVDAKPGDVKPGDVKQAKPPASAGYVDFSLQSSEAADTAAAAEGKNK